MSEFFSISLWSAIAGVCCLAIWLGMDAWEKRCEKQAMAHLKGMNRGVMDSPDWGKKPWQHDAGECTQRAAETSARIEVFADSSNEISDRKHSECSGLRISLKKK